MEELEETTMIKQLSNNITSFLLYQDIIQEEKQEIYSYGFEYIISLLISMFGIGIIGITTGRLYESAGWSIGFMMTRSVAGGYHAKTHRACQILTYAVYISNLIIIDFIETYVNFNNILILSAIGITLIYLFAPIEHENKPFSNDEYLIYKKKSRFTAITLCMLATIGVVIFNKYQLFFVSIVLGLLTTALSIIAVKIKGGKKDEES